MGNFVIKTETLNKQYEYDDANVSVAGSITTDNGTGTVTGINGVVYRMTDGVRAESIGNFTGNPRGGMMRYTLSAMSRADSNMTWEAIEEIEAAASGSDTSNA